MLLALSKDGYRFRDAGRPAAIIGTDSLSLSDDADADSDIVVILMLAPMTTIPRFSLLSTPGRKKTLSMGKRGDGPRLATRVYIWFVIYLCLCFGYPCQLGTSPEYGAAVSVHLFMYVCM